MSKTFFYAVVSLAVLGLAFTVQTASACPNPYARMHGSILKVPARGNAFGLNKAPVNNSFVGLWQLTWTLDDGTPFDMSFITFHDDGTENDNDMAPPLTSNVCEGVWEKIGPRTIKVHHVGWIWDVDGTTLLGPFTVEETNTLSEDGNSFSGTFTFRIWTDVSFSTPADLPITGKFEATRITVSQNP